MPITGWVLETLGDSTMTVDVAEKGGALAQLRRLVTRTLLVATTVFLAAYGVIALLELWRAVIGSSRAAEASGFVAMFGMSSLFVSFSLAREAITCRGGDLLQTVLRSFGRGWIAGVSLLMMILLGRVITSSSLRSLDLFGVTVEVLSLAIVPLILSIPGLAALAIARRRAM
jgi:hypothetical protein